MGGERGEELGEIGRRTRRKTLEHQSSMSQINEAFSGKQV